jgi:hypothetical protein
MLSHSEPHFKENWQFIPPAHPLSLLLLLWQCFVCPYANCLQSLFSVITPFQTSPVEHAPFGAHDGLSVTREQSREARTISVRNCQFY